ncbi:MAG: hypothetical protein ABH828_01115 [archaeon]
MIETNNLSEILSIDKLVDVFNNFPIIYISPHFDDFALSNGGFAFTFQNKLAIRTITVFSQSQYVSPEYELQLKNQLSEQGNSDKFSEERIRHVSNILRINEDNSCLESLDLEPSILLGKDEAPIRGYGLGDGKEGITFPTAPQSWLENPKEIILVNSLKKEFKNYMSEKMNIFIPLGVQYHIDHVLVRKAAISAANELNTSGELNVNLFFYEDLPYAGLSTNKSSDWNDAKKIIANCTPEDIIIDLEKKLGLIDFFPSQREDGYFRGIKNRAIEIGKMHMSEKNIQSMERIYKLNTNKIYELTKLDDYLN